MKNLKYFIDLESENQKKGMGDVTEGSLVMNDVKWTIMHPETNEVLFVSEAKRSTLRYDEVLHKPVFCSMALGLDDLEPIEEEIEGRVNTKIVFTEQQRNEMVDEFGEYVLVIPATLFIRNITSTLDGENLEYATGKVEYGDYSVNHQYRFVEFETGDPKILFHKDSSLAYQKEFRVVILNRDIEDALTINIGDMTEYSTIVKSEDLLTGKFGVQLQLK